MSRTGHQINTIQILPNMSRSKDNQPNEIWPVSEI